MGLEFENEALRVVEQLLEEERLDAVSFYIHWTAQCGPVLQGSRALD